MRLLIFQLLKTIFLVVLEEIDAKGMYDTELGGGAKLRADLGSQTYQPPVGSYEGSLLVT